MARRTPHFGLHRPRSRRIARMTEPRHVRAWDSACRRFFDDYEAAYAEVRADPEAWAEVLRERAAIDPVLVPYELLPREE